MTTLRELTIISMFAVYALACVTEILPILLKLYLRLNNEVIKISFCLNTAQNYKII